VPDSRFDIDALRKTISLSEFKPGLLGEAPSSGPGVLGIGNQGPGVQGESQSGSGVAGSSASGEGVTGETNSSTMAAVAGYNRNPQGTGAGIYGEKAGTVGHAGFFAGNVHVTGSITVDGDVVLSRADCAEEFAVAEGQLAVPGTVMVVGQEGLLRACDHSYDRRVAGVISGAGDYQPGIVLDKQKTGTRGTIALVGKVFCRVDASYGAIEIGDLLTTSNTPGHAMRMGDPGKGFGSSIGKALRPHKNGKGLIPVLVALQ
jgi:hypothetical protein